MRTILTILTALFIFLPALILIIYHIVGAWYYIHDPGNWDKP